MKAFLVAIDDIDGCNRDGFVRAATPEQALEVFLSDETRAELHAGSSWGDNEFRVIELPDHDGPAGPVSWGDITQTIIDVSAIGISA